MNIQLILKGFIVGLGKIIPGVSGSMLAMMLGVYDELIEAITDFFGNPKKHIRLLFFFGLGVLIAILLFSRFLLFLLNYHYEVTMYLFLGLILGTFLPFVKKLKFTKKNFCFFFLFFLGSWLVSFLPLSLQFSTYPNFLFLILGMIDAITSIVPGISGTAIFIQLGVYEKVLSILAHPFSFLFFLYGFGVIIGIIITCYIMHYLLKKFCQETYFAIFSFMLLSLFSLFLNLKTFFQPFLLFFLFLGLIIGYFFDKS